MKRLFFAISAVLLFGVATLSLCMAKDYPGFSIKSDSTNQQYILNDMNFK